MQNFGPGLNSLKGVYIYIYIGDYIGSITGVIKGDARSLEYIQVMSHPHVDAWRWSSQKSEVPKLAGS